MKEHLKCDRCGTVYSDVGSINMAKASKKEWEALCKRDGVVARGSMPCPNVRCKGELVLHK